MIFLREVLGVADIENEELQKANKIQINNFSDFTKEINKRKQDDHHASHSNEVNQFLHLLSSSLFIYCYKIMFTRTYSAVNYAILSMVLRQSGHIVFEPPCHDDEKLQLGFNTRSKIFVVCTYALTPLSYFFNNNLYDILIAKTGFFIFGHTIILWNTYDYMIALIWFVKFFTDPFTDVIAYYPSAWKVWTSPDWNEAKKMHVVNHYLGKQD
tara:strand:+ start:11545 stop:12180 length:636 start_codon:yes stop_codon:yes gene_type:complete